VVEIPFLHLLGLNLDSFDMRDELVGNSHFKILLGGVIASMDDIWRFETGSPEHPLILKGGTINLRIDYLRPYKGKHFVASGSIRRTGRK
jgi:acyl-coenzyme A thioesterase PaaI-like protein